MQPIYQFAKNRFNLVMALTINEIRKTNLLILIDEVGKKSAIAKLADTDPAYISQVLSENPKHSRNIGEDFARKLESGCGKPRGWMDQYHPRNVVGHINATLDGAGGAFQGQVDTQAKPPIIDEDAWKQLPPKNRALIEDLLIGSTSGKLKEDHVKVIQNMLDALSKD